MWLIRLKEILRRERRILRQTRVIKSLRAEFMRQPVVRGELGDRMIALEDVAGNLYWYELQYGYEQ